MDYHSVNGHDDTDSRDQTSTTILDHTEHDSQGSTSPAPKSPLPGTPSLPQPKSLQLSTKLLRSILSRSWMIHVFALGATAAAIHLSFTGFYWADEGDWKNVQSMGFLKGQDTQNALQFAAKLHEILIQGSLSAIVLHVLRRMLIGDGISWGLISGCYQVGAPLWLLSPEFWANIRPSERRGCLMALALFFLVIYSNTIGPFSAIVISPILEWWPVEKPFYEAMSSWIDIGPDAVYPTYINHNYTTQTGAYACNEYGLLWCPDGGMEDVRSIVEGFAKNNGRPEGEIWQQLTDVSRELVSSTDHFSTENDHMSISTTLHASVAELTGGFWNYVNASDHLGPIHDVGRPKLIPKVAEIFAPVVQVQCSHFSWNEIKESDEVPAFRTASMRDFSIYGTGSQQDDWYRTQNNLRVPETFTDALEDYLSSGREHLKRQTIRWIDPMSLHKNGPSLAALVTVPILDTQEDREPRPAQDSLILPCMIDAHWAGVDTHYDPTADKTLPNNLTDFDIIKQHYWREETASSDMLNARKIFISPEWAGYLSHEVVNRNSSVSAMEYLLGEFILADRDDNDLWDFQTANWRAGAEHKERRDDAAKAVASVLSLALVEGISRVVHRRTFGLVLQVGTNGTSEIKELYLQSEGGEKPAHWESTRAMADYYTIEWRVDRKGWGYGLRTPTIKAGIAVLLIHAVIVLSYAIYIISFRMGPDGWAMWAWSGFGEVLAIGLKSRRPTESGLLEKLVSGSEKRSTATTKVAVRLNDEMRPEIQVGSDITDRRLEREEKYPWV